jgi:hypothetical protein
MVDEIQSGIAPNPIHPTTNAFGQIIDPEPDVAKVDHIAMIAELAKSLHNVSPSGAETVSAKILQHIADIKDPKAYDERMAAEKKASDEAAAASKKAKEAANKAA